MVIDLLNDESPEDRRRRLGVKDFMRDMRKLKRQMRPPSRLGTSFAYLCVFCAAALLLCFVLWVASCTLKAMQS